MELGPFLDPETSGRLEFRSDSSKTLSLGVWLKISGAASIGYPKCSRQNSRRLQWWRPQCRTPSYVCSRHFVSMRSAQVAPRDLDRDGSKSA